MYEKSLAKDSLVSNLTEEQLDELMTYAPAFSETNLANIKAHAFEKITTPEVPLTSPGPERKFTMKKFLLIAAAIIMLLVTSTAVFAAVTDFDFGQVFNSLFNNPDAANLMDVGQTVENNGIEVTLLYAYADGDQVYAMLEVRDLEGSRVGEDMFLMFKDFIAQVSTPIVYDETEGRALMGITTWTFSPREVGDYIALSLEYILAGYRRVDGPIDFPLQEYLVEREMMAFEEWGEATADGSYGSPDGMANRPGKPEWLLVPGAMEIDLPGLTWGVITNIGVHDGMLHIQTRRTEEWDHFSNSGNLILLDSDGVEYWWAFRLMSGDYAEYIFDLDEVKDIATSSLGFMGVETDETIIGPWDFYFPITAMAERRYLTVELTDHQYFSQIEVVISPMTTTISYAAAYEENCSEHISRMMSYVRDFGALGYPFLNLRDDSMVELFSRDMMYGPEGGWHRYNTLYFDIAELHSVTVLGVEYLINR